MKLKLIIILLLSFLLGFFLRFYQLGQIPSSLDWDEASLGWNAYSIIKTGTDEYGQRYPISALRSFNDYKSPLYVYAAAVPISIFGLTEWTTRFPSALTGVISVALVFFLVKQMQKTSLVFPAIAAVLFAVSPWSLIFSRVAFEANLAQGLFLTAACSFVLFLNRKRGIFLITAGLFFSLSMYAYHSSKIIVPLFLMGMFLVYFKNFRLHWKTTLITLLVSLTLLFPLIKNTLKPGSLSSSRFQSVSIFSSPDIVPVFLNNYLNQFSPNFLFILGDKNPRHSVPDMGLLYIWELPFLIAGLYFLFSRPPTWRSLILWWLLIAPIGAALTSETPHAVRGLIILPTFQIIVAFGLWQIMRSVSGKKKIVLSTLIAGLFFVNIYYFLHQYFIHMPLENAPSWQYGYKQLVNKVSVYQNQYSRIYVTNAYDQPYIYFLFYGQKDPTDKNPGDFSSRYKNIIFADDKTISTAFGANIGGPSLYVVSLNDILQSDKIIDQVNFPDERVAFVIGKN